MRKVINTLLVLFVMSTTAMLSGCDDNKTQDGVSVPSLPITAETGQGLDPDAVESILGKLDLSTITYIPVTIQDAKFSKS